MRASAWHTPCPTRGSSRGSDASISALAGRGGVTSRLGSAPNAAASRGGHEPRYGNSAHEDRRRPDAAGTPARDDGKTHTEVSPCTARSSSHSMNPKAPTGRSRSPRKTHAGKAPVSWSRMPGRAARRPRSRPRCTLSVEHLARSPGHLETSVWVSTIVACRRSGGIGAPTVLSVRSSRIAVHGRHGSPPRLGPTLALR